MAKEPFGKLKSASIKSLSTRSVSADCLSNLEGEGTKTPPHVDAQSETSSVTSYERLTELIRWVPGSHKELFEAEDKLLAFVRWVRVHAQKLDASAGCCVTVLFASSPNARVLSKRSLDPHANKSGKSAKSMESFCEN